MDLGAFRGSVLAVFFKSTVEAAPMVRIKLIHDTRKLSAAQLRVVEFTWRDCLGHLQGSVYRSISNNVENENSRGLHC